MGRDEEAGFQVKQKNCRWSRFALTIKAKATGVVPLPPNGASGICRSAFSRHLASVCCAVPGGITLDEVNDRLYARVATLVGGDLGQFRTLRGT